MEYVLVFLEGIVTFVSPCLLPMLPLYVGYFMGAGGAEKSSRGGTIARALGFVAGFTLLFVLMGAFAGTIGGFFIRYSAVVNVVGGLIVIFLGLVYLGVFNIPIFRGVGVSWRGGGFWTSALMGMVFSVGWTPCVGAFLGSALVLAAQSGGVLRGALMLLIYSAGLGIPFVLGALLIDRLKNVLGWFKRHGETISRVSGALLIALGILMATGLLGKILGLIA